MAEETTTIQITTDTWQRLNSQKIAPSDSFDDVISRLLDEREE